MKLTRLFGLLGIAATVASATSVTFTFDTQTINGTTITGITNTATTGQIQSYMDQVLSAAGCAGCMVTITGTGAAADQTYNGDGHVVGNNGSSLTLGTSNNAISNSSQTPSTGYDTFLANTNDNKNQLGSQITMKFSGFTINGSASFAYEIFPNGLCPSLANCGTNNSNLPDFEFEAGTNSNGIDAPVSSFGNNGIQTGVVPKSTGSDGSATNSPAMSGETAPQYIGTWNGTLSNVNELDFVDWPATIGIDNLSVSWGNTSPVPETSSILLLGTILAGITARKKFRKAA
jgi:hypothetical protein